MGETTQCVWCGKELTARQVKADGRFCGTSCSAKWRMRQPEILAKVHSPEVAAKRGKKKSAWLHSGTPEANAEMERIRTLNPTDSPEVRAKISATLRAMGHRPKARGGNGRGPTLAQKVLWELLGEGWYLEYPVTLGPKLPGYPTCYKVDIGNPSAMVAVEVDGPSHHSRKAEDLKRDAKLRELGWTVLRFWNQEVLASALSVVEAIRSASTTCK